MRGLYHSIPLALGLAWSGPASADQLQCNDQASAEKAARLLSPGSVVIDFCSLCTATVKVVKVEAPRVVKDCQFEVALAGQLLAESSASFTDGYDPKRAQYASKQGSYSERLDLAYVYIETSANVFEWLGGQIGLKADVNTSVIRLPSEVYARLGSHELSPVAAKKNALATPSPEQVQLTWHHFYNGQGRPPLLVEAKPCLEVDNKKGSETRFECLEMVEGPVPKGTTVLLWTAWLIAQGDQYKDVMVQFVHEGVVRTTRDLDLQGRSVRTRTYTGSKLSKTGRWEIVIRRGEEVLRKIPVTVR